MDDKLCKDLNSLNIPIRKQGSVGSEETYPSTFITFWNIDTPDSSFYEGQPTFADYTYDLTVSSNDPILKQEIFNQAVNLLLTSGWIIEKRRGRDTLSDVDTHTAIYTRIYYKYKYKEE